MGSHTDIRRERKKQSKLDALKKEKLNSNLKIRGFRKITRAKNWIPVLNEKFAQKIPPGDISSWIRKNRFKDDD
ncbi:hypothetical protein D7221_01570 [Legionella pneumophila]|uniref:Uncharacterized protein n=1 Tax=Legionella pneumophila (strain Lens) TaxID=297245 RepID=Q5WW73_LEGPL|nr:hypothetical protein BE841_04905 [Legionella pneumophila subsp. pneumophila]RYW86335.1 hypothetical protein D7216_01575 [Legionella pneumophila]CAH15826.1 hypothetical protein lpl1586 [Legionella pneumophila str. Lens]AOW54566.1 hypothetical protein BE842_03850 [Legionella pneumophila subsp. pneumophila]AOW57134.1 hypothetical protein BE843_02115 [Legionella pneumophila subsp. pneumophila]